MIHTSNRCQSCEFCVELHFCQLKRTPWIGSYFFYLDRRNLRREKEVSVIVLEVAATISPDGVVLAVGAIIGPNDTGQEVEAARRIETDLGIGITPRNMKAGMALRIEAIVVRKAISAIARVLVTRSAVAPVHEIGKVSAFGPDHVMINDDTEMAQVGVCRSHTNIL